jgi:putative addiction module component (TIGR02574 family)
VDPTTVLEAVRSWPVEDQLEFVFDVWDRLVDAGWHPEATEELKAELDRRLASHEADPTNVLSWEQVVERLGRPR